MDRPSPSRSHITVKVVICVCLLITSTGSLRAETFRLAGGMGLTVWPMSLDRATRTHSGVGLGITGRVMVRLFEHLRLQTGLLQGQFGEEDGSETWRSYVFFGAEAELPLFLDAYTAVGARVGGAHLTMIETISSQGDDTRLVRDVNRWTLLVEPMVSLGYLIADRFHVELEGGAALDVADEGVDVSFVMLVGVYFKMWSR